MSDAPERISLELRQGMADDFWSECRDPRYAKSEPVAYVRADRIEKLEALLREAMAALEEIEARDKLPTPSYGGVTPGQYAYVHRAGPFAEIARATLAKLRAHLGETE